jgi:flagellar biosynthesis/type III secretory pathway protein FliH
MRDFGFSLGETDYEVKFVEADDAANDPLEDELGEEEDGSMEDLEYVVRRVYTQAEMDAAVKEANLDGYEQGYAEGHSEGLIIGVESYNDGYNQGYDEGFEHGYEEGASK